MALRRLQPLPSLRELGDRPPVTWAGEATPSPVVASRQQAPVSPFVQPFAKALPQYVSPSPVIKKPVYRDIKPPIAKAEPSVAKPDEPPEDVEFWERALQVFAAPFVWVDEYVIKPTLSLATTAVGLVGDVDRGVGEDFWDWKRRSWADEENIFARVGFNYPALWGGGDWRLDIKGILEMTPWLLIPGAGQVGGSVGKGLAGAGARMAGKVGARPAKGLAGKLGTLEKVGQETWLGPTFKALAGPGRVAGTLLEYTYKYSPWGLAERSAATVIKGGVRIGGTVTERVTKATAGKIFNKFSKLPEPDPPPEAVEILTRHIEEWVKPAFRAFQEEVPAMRKEQARVIWESIDAHFTNLGDLSNADVATAVQKMVAAADKQLKKTGIKSEFAIDEATIAKRNRQAKAKLNKQLEAKEILKPDYDAAMKVISEAEGRKPFNWADNEDAVGAIFRIIATKVQDAFLKRDSLMAMQELLMKGTIPEPRFFEQWASVFGRDFAVAVDKLARLKPSVRAQIIDGLNLPRAVLSTMDFSATLRQGLILSIVRPQDVPRSFWRQGKYFFSEKHSRYMADAIRNHAYYPYAVRYGLELPDIPGSLTRRGGMREELWVSSAAEKLPFVKRSGRAFTGYLNEMRMSAFEAGYNGIKGIKGIKGELPLSGAKTTAVSPSFESDLRLLTKFINHASGRGKLPLGMDQYSDLFGTLLFSPKYQMSTLGLPRIIGQMLLNKNPYLRKQGAHALVRFVGGGVALAGLLNETSAFGSRGMDIDPRSANFGKIKIGNQTLDPWRGYAQYIRFAGQMLTGESKSANDNLTKEDKFKKAVKLLQSKSSPALGLMIELMKGENYMGEPIFSGTTGFIKQVRDRMLPLALQDIMDAMEMDGMNGLAIAAPSAFLGVGVLTMVNDLNLVRQKIAKAAGYEAWDAIDPKTRREIEQTNVELQAATLAFERQTQGRAWADYEAAAKAVEESYRENIELAAAEFAKTGDGYTFNQKVKEANLKRRGGYQARDKQERFADLVRRFSTKNVTESLVGVGPEQTAIRVYRDALYGDDMYDEFGNYRWEERAIREQQLREKLGQELFDYVLEYNEAKYNTFPPIYLQLVKARKVLKPYWEVKQEADRYFGVRDSKSKDKFIARRRKTVKRADPLIGYYLELFYVRED